MGDEEDADDDNDGVIDEEDLFPYHDTDDSFINEDFSASALLLELQVTDEVSSKILQ